MKRHTGYGWLELIEGILLIILGALAIASPGGILRWITIFYGVMAIVTGITDIIFYAKSERYIGFAPCVSLAAGVISVITGLALMAYPHIGELVVTLLLFSFIIPTFFFLFFRAHKKFFFLEKSLKVSLFVIKPIYVIDI